MTIHGLPVANDPGRRFSQDDAEYIMLTVDVSDFSDSLAVGTVGIVQPTGTGHEFAAIPNADSQKVELAVFLGHPASIAAPGHSSVAAATADGVYLFQLRGACKALVNGTADIAIGDPLEVLKNTNNFVLDGSTGTMVRNAATGAIAREVVTANEDTLASIYLLGGNLTPAAS